MQTMLHMMVDKKASDLHITANASPMMRVDGVLVALPFPALSAADTKQLCYAMLTEAQKDEFEKNNELDFSFGLRGVSRFRGNMFVQRGAVAGAFRQIPFKIRTIEELELPPVIRQLTHKATGLILVTGPTGSGKTTTLASMVDAINEDRRSHIITVEDPVEYLHTHKSGLINQREVGSDTHDFRLALKYVLRQDPDVVLIGEMRDLETIESALIISETGHLTFGTLHTHSAPQAISRIIDVFPPHQQSQVRSQLASVLEAVISQQLMPRIGGGMVVATEVMLATPAIRNLIREDKVHQVYTQMQVGRKFGMQTMAQALAVLVQKRTISMDDALAGCSEQDELRQLLISQKA